MSIEFHLPKLDQKRSLSKNVPSVRIRRHGGLLKEATTRITHDGLRGNPLMIGISPLLSLFRENGGSCFFFLGGGVGGGGEEVFQDCVILIDFGGGGGEERRDRRGGNESEL